MTAHTSAACFPLLLECFTGCIALTLYAFFLLLRKFTPKSIMVIVICSIPALVMSLESMNSFLTCDESYSIYEPVDLVNSTLTSWNMGAFRTTDLLVGVPIAVLKKATGASMDILAVIAKSLHWLLSFCMILLIIDLLCRYSSQRGTSPAGCLLLLYAVMLLPVSLLAQKIITYDALSLFGGVAALLLLIYGCIFCSRVYTYASVAVALLAAQEKLIASPLLWICMTVAAVLLSRSAASPSQHLLLKTAIINSLRLIAMVLIIFTIEHAAVALINNTGQPHSSAFNMFFPLISGFWPILRAAGIEMNELSMRPSMQLWWWIPCIAATSAVMLVAAASVLCSMVNLVRKIPPKHGFFKHAAGKLQYVNYLLFFLLFCTGIAATYGITAYLAPCHPVAPGMYEAATFNKTFVFFGAYSLMHHLFFSAGWACATFSNTIPSVFILIAAVNFIAVIRKKLPPLPGLDAACIAALCAPLLYSIAQIPAGSRYFNMFILIVITRLAIDFLRIGLSEKKFGILTLLFVAALIAETAPFRPLYGAFRPIWSNYPSTYNVSPSRAVLNPWWMGWGEEVFLAGKLIEKELNKSGKTCAGVTLYHNYLGEWLFRKNGMKIIHVDSVNNFGYTENDFFVLNRMGITQSHLSFPENVIPFAVIRFRGFVQAWVFRGSDLKTADFRFTVSPSLHTELQP